MNSHNLYKFGLSLLILLSGNLQAADNWFHPYENLGNHYADNYYLSTTMRDWLIEPDDVYLAGRFAPADDFVMVVKPGNSYIVMHHLSQYNDWWMMIFGGNNIGNLWTTRHDDMYVIGDFDGDTYDEILLANPDGKYRTLKLNGMTPPNFAWSSMQYATNGDIDVGDKLVAGDFNGDSVDEVMLIKANGSHQTMQLNTATQNWDILSSANNGSIYWWGISHDDKFVTGDFNNDGHDELLAINGNGWHHTMYYSNNQWLFLEGNGSGQIGLWNISASHRFLTGDFDGDGSDELIAISPWGGWAHTMELVNNSQWQWMTGNAGNGMISNWPISSNDVYLIQHRGPWQDHLMTVNSNGWWKKLRYGF